MPVYQTNVATLVDGKIQEAQLPDSVAEVKATWDAGTGVYPANPDDGDMHIVTGAGTVDYVDYIIGDVIIYSTATGWTKIDNKAYEEIGVAASLMNTQNVLTGEPTGFTNQDNVGVSFDPDTKKVTLTGSFQAYYQGTHVPVLTNNWQSAAISDAPTSKRYLYYGPSGLVWSSDSWLLEYMQIAMAYYTSNGTYQFTLRETHGLTLDSKAHEIAHYRIGTAKHSGGTLDPASYVLNSTTNTNRRPNIVETVLADEDLKTTLPALTSKSYSRFYLSGAGVENFETAQSEIVNLNGNVPYYNQFNGSTWVQTPLANNAYMCIWVLGLPVASDATSQGKRFLFVQGQSSGTLASQQALSPINVNLGSFASPEYTFLNQIIIQYTASNWKIVEVNALSGSKSQYVAAPSGNFLSGVSTDESLNGNGTTTSPLTLATNTVAYSVGNISGNTTLDYTNGAFQKATLTDAVTLLAPSNGTEGNCLRLWLTASGADRVLSLDAAILIPSDSTFTTKTLTSGKLYILQLQHNGSAWMLITLVGGY